MNEAWFKAQPKDVQDAIRAAGRDAEQKAFPWVLDNNKKSNDALARQQGRNPEAAGGGAGGDDEDLSSPSARRSWSRPPAVKAEFVTLQSLVAAKQPK